MNSTNHRKNCLISEKGEGHPHCSEVENSINHPSICDDLSEAAPSGQVRRVYALLLAVSFLMILCYILGMFC